LWDSARRRLLLARDPLGHRPLHYHRSSKFFAFASMPKGLHALPDIPYAPDEERVVEFLAMMPETGTQSFFVGIERVEPAHVVMVTANGVAARRHWQPTRGQITLHRPEDYAEALRDLLDQAVSCRLRGTGDVGAYLSGGLDSGAVVATAARLLAPTNRRVIAFTSVPREGYDGPTRPGCIIDERANAAATAALYPNIEHVLVPNKGHSPLANIDRKFFLLDRPFRRLCATGWAKSCDDAIRNRKLKVVLEGGYGGLTLSYDGMELLPELLRSGRWLHLWREASALVAARRSRWRGVLANTFGPWCPPALWGWINKTVRKAITFQDFAAIHPSRFDELAARAKARNSDFALPLSKDGLALRRRLLQLGDPGNFCKAGLADMQVDFRDPTGDVRLLEFCFAVPTEQFLRDGMPRALARRAFADRLPKQVIEETRTGLTVADWHEDVTAARDEIIDELDRLDGCPAAAAALDLPRMRRLTESWPSSGWERGAVFGRYRYALLRGIAVGYFLRRATGSNLSRSEA
jgi:asparagine synthase (glutamine-hydrolysing)